MSVLPNLFTLARVVLTPFIGWAILQNHYTQALWLCFLAGLSDGIDGRLARRLNSTTRFGAYLDPVADKLLMSVVYICLGVAGQIPWWMVGVIFGRDLFILGMVAWGFLFTTVRQFPPSIWGKVSTALQILAALVVMGNANSWLRPKHAWPHQAVLLAMILATIWSGIHYAWYGLTQLRATTIDAGTQQG